MVKTANKGQKQSSKNSKNNAGNKGNTDITGDSSDSEDNKISSKDISVVIQGAIDGKTIKNVLVCLRSTRKTLPESEIILSTWKNTDAEILKIIEDANKAEKLYDMLLLNDDPMAIRSSFYHGKGTEFNNNIFRQIFSSREGLKKATKKYALKMRNDFKMKNTNFLDYFDKFDDYRMDEMKILKKRIVIPSVYTCKVFYRQDHCFCFTDWWHFGLREDVLKLWDIPFENDPCYKGLVDDKKDKKIAEKMLVPANYFHEEQYLWGNLAKMNGVDFEMTDESDFKLQNAVISEKLLVNNAVVVNFEKSGFEMLKFERRFSSKSHLYYHYDWLNLYKQYCNKNVAMPNRCLIKFENLSYITRITCLRHATRIIKAINRCKKEFKNCDSQKNFVLILVKASVIMVLKILYEILSVIFYAIKTVLVFTIFLFVKAIFFGKGTGTIH